MSHPQGPGGYSSLLPAPRIFLATTACQSGKPLQRDVRSGQPPKPTPGTDSQDLEVLPLQVLAICT
jgi:hypothetical protein